VGTHLERVRLLLESDLALYSAHLPLDAHPEFGNSALLARELGLTVRESFARYESIHCGVAGSVDEPTAALVERASKWAAQHGHHAVASPIPAGHRTKRWAICSGAGANQDTLREAYDSGVDLLIVGEGPHWSAVEAEEHGVVIVYAGHYATETLGVRALGEHLATKFDLPWTFLRAPTGL
jgi:putative NIF3 family GTP cyclohydrolase 1 type 2